MIATLEFRVGYFWYKQGAHLKTFSKFFTLASLILVILVIFQNCSKSTFSASTADSSSGDDTNILSAGGCRFTGGAIAYGERVWAYQNSGVPTGSQCVVEERACSNGVLSGSFNFRTCSAGAPAACIFNGQQIESGKSADAFETSSVAFGAQCAKQSRQCNNGTLSGTFEFGACSPGAPLSCLFNGQQIAHGAPPVLAFPTSTVAYDKTCTPELRTCRNGVLSGNAGSIFSTCSPGAPASCTLNGQNIPHGGSSGFLFTTASVPFGSMCPAAVQRVCTNNVLSNANAVHATCVTQDPPTCGVGQVFNTTSLKCETCSGDGQNYSLSQKKCVSTCTGGVVIQLRYTNTGSMDAAQNPYGFNMDAGFTINRNGTDYVVGKPGSSLTFMNKLNQTVAQNLQMNGVRDAYQAGINEIAGLSGVSVTLGNIFDVIVNVGDSAVNLPGREVVLSGSGDFKVKSYFIDGGAPPSHQYTRFIWCK